MIPLLISLSLIAAQKAPVLNPAWKFNSNGQMESVSIQGDLMAYGMFEEYGVVDLKAGKVLWKRKLGDKNWSSDVEFIGNTLYIASGNETFKAVEARTGKTLWSIPRKGFSSGIGTDGKRAFAELSMGVISAIDLKTRKPVWTYNLDKGVAKPDDKNPRLTERPEIYDGKLFVSATGGYTLALNPETGAVIWRVPVGARYEFSLSFAKDSVLAWQSGAVTALDVKTGHLKWKAKIPGQIEGKPAVQNGRIYFVTNRPKAVCIGLDSRNVWTVPLGEATRWGSNDIIGLTPTTDGLLLFDSANLRWLSPEDGRELHSLGTLPTSLSQPPLPYKGDFLLLGTDVMTRLSPNAPPEVVDAKAKATEMVGRLEKLDRTDRLVFSRLGPEAFDVLYRVTLKKIAEYRASQSQKLSGFLDAAAEQVEFSAKAEYTDQMLALYEAAKGTEAEAKFLQPLLQKGREEAIVPIALALIQKGDEQSVGLGLNKLTESRDPRVVSLFADALQNPEANEEVRAAAYLYLANIGGPAEIDLVRKARRTHPTIVPFYERMELDRLGIEKSDRGLVATHTDAKGTLWGLVKSGVLGSGSDLWIVRRQDNHWVDPVFTGVMEERTFRIGLKKQPPPQTVQGVPIKQVVEGAWVKLFVDNPKLRVDTDKDGLTDIAEARLGTNPKSSDTDGDGLTDAFDGNPLAPRRALSETEQILAAAAEARYHDSSDYRQPALLEMPKGMKPFEIRGWGGPVIWADDSRNHPLRQCWEQGTGFLSFSPRPDNDELPASTPLPDRFVSWSPDHKTATVTISTYFGGLNGTGYEVNLRKFGEDWLVVGMKMAWIS